MYSYSVEQVHIAVTFIFSTSKSSVDNVLHLFLSLCFITLLADDSSCKKMSDDKSGSSSRHVKMS